MNYKKLKKLELIECCEKFDTQVKTLKEQNDKNIEVANDKISVLHRAKINAETIAKTYKESNTNLIRDNKALYTINDKPKNVKILIIIITIISLVMNIVLIAF